MEHPVVTITRTCLVIIIIIIIVAGTHSTRHRCQSSVRNVSDIQRQIFKRYPDHCCSFVREAMNSARFCARGSIVGESINTGESTLDASGAQTRTALGP